jgi:hypothetical protein
MRWRSARQLEGVQDQAYTMAREAFQVMHKNSDLPLTPQHLNWTDKGANEFLMEADGNKVSGTERVPSRWYAKLRHMGEIWTVESADWK